MDYELTDNEAILLDGKVSAGVQLLVDAAKLRMVFQGKNAGLSTTEASLITDMVEEATKKKKLGFRYTRSRRCKCCGKDGGYAKYKGTGRHHKKGDLKYDKPLYITAISYADDFVTLQGYPRLSCCLDCNTKLLPTMHDALRNIEAELPECLATKKYKRYEIMECSSCYWSGPQSQMDKLPALMGGEYLGGCPECEAKNTMFHTPIKGNGEYIVEEMQP